MGINTATLANCSMAAPKKPFVPADFMPSERMKKEQEKPKPKRFSRKKFADGVRAMMRAACAIPGSNVVLVEPQKKPQV
jgi:hypothetical protein